MDFMTNLRDVSLALTAVMLLFTLGWLVSLRTRLKLQRKQIEEQMKREAALDQKYRELFEQANDMVFSHGLGGHFLTLNKAGEKILGCTREKALRMSLREFVAPDHLPAFDQWLAQCAQGDNPAPLELGVGDSGDKASMIEINAHRSRGGPEGATLEGIARDITEKKRAEEALRQSEERFSSAFRVSPVAIAICTLAEWRFIDVNQSFLKLFGFEREEVLSHTTTELDIWHGTEDRARIEGAFRQNRSVAGAECRFKVKNGTVRTTLVFAEPVNLGKERCALTIVHDITERLLLEAQLRQALKMEAVGRLAAGVAHDFNNLLTVIQGNAELVIARQPHDFAFAQEISRVNEAAQRAAGLTRQLLTFSRQQNLQRKPLDLNQVVNIAIRMFKHLLHHDITLRLKYAPNLPLISADMSMLEQVLMNLVVNAKDAMPKGGDLAISTTTVEVLPDYVTTHPEAKAGPFVCLVVADTGCGMDAATQSRIFEPFFTTKEPGKGTGLGLATVYGIAKQHNGWVEVASQVGAGSTFKIYLPAEPGTAQRERKPSPLLRPEAKMTILSVEDEAAVAELNRKILEAEGHYVLEAADALLGMQMWNDHQHKIDLLLTDIVMPRGMSGVDLAENLRTLRPDLKVLFTTAYNPESFNEGVFTTRNTWLLPKPFLPSQLVQAVNTVRQKVPGLEG